MNISFDASCAKIITALEERGNGKSCTQAGSGDCSEEGTEHITRAQAPSYGQEVTGSGNKQCGVVVVVSKGGQPTAALQTLSPGLAARSDPEQRGSGGRGTALAGARMRNQHANQMGQECKPFTEAMLRPSPR